VVLRLREKAYFKLLFRY